MATNDTAYYRSALEALATKTPMPAMHDGHPHAGYYKMRAAKDGPWLPVAIYVPSGETEFIAVVGPKASEKRRDPASIWTFCGHRPVHKAAFDTARETGAWPDEAPEQTVIGDNSRDLTLAEQIRDYAAQALAWLRKSGIKDTTTKDTAANYRAKLLDLGKQADAEREKRVRPHLDAQRAINAELKPLIDEATAAANEIRDALGAYMRAEEAELRKRAEAERQAEAERVAAENKRIDDERAKLMRDDPITALTTPEPERPTLPPEEPVKVQAGGQRGRKTGLRTVTRYTVTDYAAALAHCKDHPAIREAVEKVCCAQAKAGAVVPGVEAREERVAA